jgi:hypothetical protein
MTLLLLLTADRPRPAMSSTVLLFSSVYQFTERYPNQTFRDECHTATRPAKGARVLPHPLILARTFPASRRGKHGVIENRSSASPFHLGWATDVRGNSCSSDGAVEHVVATMRAALLSNRCFVANVIAAARSNRARARPRSQVDAGRAATAFAQTSAALDCCTAGFRPRLWPQWVMCGRRLIDKSFFTLMQHWSGAVMCPAC